MKRVRVVMLCGRGASTNYMFNGIFSTANIVGIIMEDKPRAWSMVRWRIRHLGLWRVVGQLAFMMVNRLLVIFQYKRIALLIAELSLDGTKIDRRLVTKVKNINDQVVIAFLSKMRPDVVVVNGTRIISSAVLNAANCPVINTHVGITPKYRGVHGGYWAAACNDLVNCGVTIHLVDKGVDTGGVLYQARIVPSSVDTINTFPLRQIAAAIPLMKMTIEDVAKGSLQVVEGIGPSRQWFHPTLCEYLWTWLSKSVR